MFGDVQPIGDLVDGIFNIEDAFLIQIQDYLAVLRVVGNITIGIHFFDCEFQRLGNQIFHRRSKVDGRAHFRGFRWDKGIHYLRERADIPTEIIAASVRHPMHVTACALAGADIATVPFKVIEQMTHHPLTDAGIAKFQADYKAVFGE